MKEILERQSAHLPRIGTEFRIGNREYIVLRADKNRFWAAPKSIGVERNTTSERLEVASIFEPDDWADEHPDEYQDGLQLLDPEPEDWGWRNVKQRTI
jgi:hypothetical protein